MKINGMEKKTWSQVEDELLRGGKFVRFQYCVSILIFTFTRPTEVYYLPPGESAGAAGLPFTVVSFLFGWWGIPWGPIFTIQTLIKNLNGGTDVTAQVATVVRDKLMIRAQQGSEKKKIRRFFKSP